MDGNEDPSVTVIRDDVRSDTQKIGLAIVVVHEVNGYVMDNEQVLANNQRIHIEDSKDGEGKSRLNTDSHNGGVVKQNEGEWSCEEELQ